MTRAAATLGLLLIGGVIGAATITVALVPALNGTRAVSIVAPSMQDTIPMGSLVYIEEAATYKVGDIVTYQVNGNTVTHEIVEWLPRPADGVRDGSLLQTKGSMNAQVDPYVITREQIVGRVVSHVPWIGMFTSLLAQLPIQVFLITLATGLYYLSRSKPRASPAPLPA